jgi:hypothetical protein
MQGLFSANPCNSKASTIEQKVSTTFNNFCNVLQKIYFAERETQIRLNKEVNSLTRFPVLFNKMVKSKTCKHLS